jgi:hypothetical protein
MIVRLVEDTAGAPPELLERFNRMAAKRAEEISPIGERMGFSVGEYLLKPRRDALLRRLRRLSVPDQETLLDQFVETLERTEVRSQAPETSPPAEPGRDARQRAELLYERTALPDWAQTRISEILLDPHSEHGAEILREFCISAFEQILRNEKNTPWSLLAEMMKSESWRRDQLNLNFDLTRVPTVLATLCRVVQEISVVVESEAPVAVEGTLVHRFSLRLGTPEALDPALHRINDRAALRLADSVPRVPEYTVVAPAGPILRRRQGPTRLWLTPLRCLCNRFWKSLAIRSRR